MINQREQAKTNKSQISQINQTTPVNLVNNQSSINSGQTTEEIQKQNWISFKIRTLSLLIMVFFIILIISLGHFYVMILIILASLRIFYEIINLQKFKTQGNPISFSSKLSWYFLFVALGYTLVNYFSELKLFIQNSYILYFFDYKKTIFFFSYMIGFICFVMSLKKKHIKDQMKLYFWTHLDIAYVLLATLSILVVYNGMIWFILSILLVAANDTFAYLFGKLFGKTQLWKLSPNKTVEGFIGGLVASTIFGLFVGYISQFSFMMPLFCPQYKFTLIPFNYPSCEIPHVFLKRNIWIRGLSNIFGTYHTNEFQIHVLILVLFVSFIAPFGGFFASALKRSLQRKDFSNIIPGHGGITDRVDCHLVMLLFVNIYLSEIIKGRMHSLSSVLVYITRLSQDDKIMLLDKLKQLIAEGKQLKLVY